MGHLVQELSDTEEECIDLPSGDSVASDIESWLQDFNTYVSSLKQLDGWSLMEWWGVDSFVLFTSLCTN